MAVKATAYFRIEAADLASWFESQGDNCWWSVDGDPLLEERLFFPCPSGELAQALRAVGKALEVWDPKEKANGQAISLPALARLASKDEQGNRFLRLRWAGDDAEWVIAEDREAATSSSSSDEAEQ